MMSKPLISVVIPCYNAEKYIKETIESVLTQRFEEFELIIMNDGSTDLSEKIIQAFDDKRIRYFYQKNAGVSTARNEGIKKSLGKYIAFLDADDLYLENNLSKKVEILESNPFVKLIHSAEIKFDTFTQKTIEIVKGKQGNVLEDLLSLSSNVIHSPSSVIVSKDTLDKLGGFDTHLSTSADWDMWVRLASLTGFAYIEEPLVKYRVHPAQMHLNIRRMEEDMCYAFKKNKVAGLFKNNLFYHSCLSNLYLILSACYYGDEKNYLKFIKFFFKSFFTNPKPIIRKALQVLKSKFKR